MIQGSNSSMGKRSVFYSTRADLIWGKPASHSMSPGSKMTSVKFTGIILVTTSRLSTAVSLLPLYAYMACLGTRGFIMQLHNCHILKTRPPMLCKCTNTRLFSLIERSASCGGNTKWCKSILDSGKLKWWMVVMISTQWQGREPLLENI